MIHINKIIRSRRRSIGLTVTSNAELIVRAPNNISHHLIEQLVANKLSWIARQQARVLARPKHLPKQYIDGEEFLYLGQTFKLRIVENLPQALVLGDDLMIHRVVMKNAQIHIQLWYQGQAFEYITNRVQYYTSWLGLSYRSIKINNAKTRWGSCNTKGNLNFCWRLILAPPRVIDYVVVHELMHLKEMNHSKKFWAEVRKVMPDYKTNEKWLKQCGHLLQL